VTRRRVLLQTRIARHIAFAVVVSLVLSALVLVVFRHHAVRRNMERSARTYASLISERLTEQFGFFGTGGKGVVDQQIAQLRELNDDIERLDDHQRLQLTRGKRRVAVEQGIDPQQPPEELVGYFENVRLRPGNVPDRAHHVDVVDLLQARDVVNRAIGRLLQAGHDDIAEILGVQGLAHEAAVTGHRIQRHLFHEPGQPTQVLAVEPAEHERGTQNHMGDGTFQDQLFLGRLGPCVKIIRLRPDHRGADVHQVPHTPGPGSVQYPFGGGDIVCDKFLFMQTADLGMQDHQSTDALHGLLPVTGLRQVRIHDFDVRVQLPQNPCIGRVLVQGNQVSVPGRLEVNDQILPDQTRPAGNEYFVCTVHSHLYISAITASY